MKICHVATVAQSLSVLLLHQMVSLQSEGYEVVAISSAGPDTSLLEASGVRHIPVHMSRRITPLADMAALGRLVAVFRREQFALIHTHTPKAGVLGRLAGRIAGVPRIVNTVHGFHIHAGMSATSRALVIALERLGARYTDITLSQNREDLEFAVSKGICKRSNIDHLGNGIDLALFNPERFSAEHWAQRRRSLGIGVSNPVVGFVGRISRRKGFDLLLSAAGMIAAGFPDVRFLVVGEPDTGKSDALDPRSVPDELRRYFTFTGLRPMSELPALISVMDVVALPSPFEGMPRSVMEASAMGIPAVVSDVKGNREVIRDGENGLLIPYGDATALAGALSTLLRDPSRRSQMGRIGIDIAHREFDERRVFERVKAVYARLAGEPATTTNQRLGFDAEV